MASNLFYVFQLILPLISHCMTIFSADLFADAPTLDQRIQVLRNLPWRNISDLASREIPEDRIPVAYLARLNEKDRILSLRASLIPEISKLASCGPHSASAIGISKQPSKSNPWAFDGVWGVGSAAISGPRAPD